MKLLDTHVLIWLKSEPTRIGPQSRAAIDEAFAADDLAVSAISFWETQMLVSKGRIAIEPTVDEWRASLLAIGISEVPVSGDIASLAGRLDSLPADPADRLIAATARLAEATLVTADRRLLDWKDETVRIDARQ